MTDSEIPYRLRILTVLVLLNMALVLTPAKLQTITAHGQINPNAVFTSQTHRTFWLRGNAALNWNRTNPGPLITVFSGDLVTTMLASDDGLTHGWFTDYNNNLIPDPGEISSPNFFSTTTFLNFTFTPVIGKNVPSPGDFTYRCPFHPFTMFGTFRVLPTTISINFASSLDTSTVTTTGSLTLDINSATLNATLTVAAVDRVSGSTTFTKTYSINNFHLHSLPGSTALVATFVLNVAVAPYSLSFDIMAQLQGTAASASAVLTRELDINGNGTVDTLDASLVAAIFGSTIGSPNYNPLADFNGDGAINVQDASVFATFFNAPALH